jgi:predicted negative regulator of RcsB-dependent stress response
MLLKFPQKLKIQRIILLVFWLGIGIFFWWLSWQSTGMSQIQRPETVAQQIYQAMPDLPKENNYIRRETGAIDPNKSLSSLSSRYQKKIYSHPF